MATVTQLMPVYQTLNNVSFLQATSGFLQNRERKAEIACLAGALLSKKAHQNPGRGNFCREKFCLLCLMLELPADRRGKMKLFQAWWRGVTSIH